MATPRITEAQVREHASDESFQRGREYQRDGAVVSLAWRDDTLEAQVWGSQATPYRVHVAFDAAGVTSATCTCPYDWGGWCKHLVAALLEAAERPQEVIERPPVRDVLAQLDRDQLVELVLALVDRAPELLDLVESQAGLVGALASPPTAPAAQQPRRATLDPEPVRRLLRAALRGGGRRYDYYGDWGSEVPEEVEDALQQAQTLVNAGDGRNALAVLDAISDVLVGESFAEQTEDGGVDLFERLGALWTEALLSADLTPRERQEWGVKLDDWQQDLDQYEIEHAFEAAQVAAEQGWDEPRLVAILRGEPLPEPTPRPLEDDEAIEEDEEAEPFDELDDLEDELGRDDAEGAGDRIGSAVVALTQARLNVLERQGRFEEFLRLARAEACLEPYVTTLVRLGRIQEAVAYGLEHLVVAPQTLVLALALRDAGALEDAVRVAEHGLSLDGRKAELATWLRDVAAGLGNADLALRAALVAFHEVPSLAAYQRTRELSGDEWPVRKAALLDYLRKTAAYYAGPQVEIFLHEGLIDDAIAALGQYTSHDLVAKVADAAITSRPDWVIRASRQQAESIMDGGKAQYYAAAAAWVRRARDAYRVMGREADWQAYHQELLARHARKYKLMPLLKALA